MSSIGLHWSALGLLSMLAAAAPGLLAGAVIGASLRPMRRKAGAAVGGAIGLVVGALLIVLLFRAQLPMGF